jgi:HEAT repeat protein
MASIQKTLEMLRDTEATITAEAIRALSDPSAAEMLVWAAHWESIPTERRLLLITRLGELSETNFDLNFSAVARHALTDSEDEVRAAAIEALWYDEEPILLRRLLDMARRDDSDEVRAEAISAVGRFILLGELGKIGATQAREAQDLAMKLYNDVDEALIVRRRAIEALGNCTRAGVADLIQEAYEMDDVAMKASAVHAMGRSCDQDWADVILDELRSDEPELRYEAARAAGELELKEAIPTLSVLLEDPDREIRENVIWALGEIGGNAARHLLENALERAQLEGDEEISEAIEEALETSSLVGEDMLFD